MTTATQSRFSKTASLLWVALCFALTFASALAWLEMGPKTATLLWDSFLADLVATLVIFAFSRFFRNSSFYDSYWSLAPPFFFAFWWFFKRSAGADEIRVALMAVVVAFWAIRLTMNWILHWEGLVEEDWRYPMLKQKSPKLELVTDLMLIHVFPTGQVFLGMLPIYAAVCLDTQALGVLDYAAFAVGMGAVLLEMIADIQLHRFVRTRQPGQVLDRGLWAYSRHPNYFGEFAFWVSLALFGVAALPSQWWWQVLGALAMLIMFLSASIPMMERKLANRPGYTDVVDRVSMFIPWPPKKTPSKPNAS